MKKNIATKKWGLAALTVALVAGAALSASGAYAQTTTANDGTLIMSQNNVGIPTSNGQLWVWNGSGWTLLNHTSNQTWMWNGSEWIAATDLSGQTIIGNGAGTLNGTATLNSSSNTPIGGSTSSSGTIVAGTRITTPANSANALGSQTWEWNGTSWTIITDTDNQATTSSSSSQDGIGGIGGDGGQASASNSSSVTLLSPFFGPMQAGMTSEQVATLQLFLAQYPEIYPEALVTGYYGPLTTAAVTRFQVSRGIPASGIVDPLTLVTLNAAVNANR